MERNLHAIRRLDKDSDESLYSELYKAGARFQPRPDGGSDVVWPNGLDQLSGSQAVAAELSLSGIHKASEAQTLPAVQSSEDL